MYVYKYDLLADKRIPQKLYHTHVLFQNGARLFRAAVHQMEAHISQYDGVVCGYEGGGEEGMELDMRDEEKGKMKEN